MESISQSRFARSIKDKLDQLSCPYTENVEESWILELVFTPGESRIRLLQWLFSKLDSKLNDILDPQHAPMETKMDSRIQRLLFVASTLGLCHSDDADLIRGLKTGSKQMKFINNLLDLVFIVDAAESSTAILCSSSNQGSLEDQFVRSCSLMNALSSQTTVDSLFPSEIRLSAPDIVRQIELDTQQQQLQRTKADRLSDLNKLNDEVSRLTKDLDRQKEMLSEILKKHSRDTSDGVASKSTLKQTMRLTFSELDQLMTSFAYCYDNEMRPWCGGLAKNNTHPASSALLGPMLKRINGPLEQFVHLLSDVQNSKTAYRKICVELQRSVSRLRDDVERLASTLLSRSDGQLTCCTLTEAIDVLERSVDRLTTSSSSSQHLSLPLRRQGAHSSSTSSVVASVSIRLR